MDALPTNPEMPLPRKPRKIRILFAPIYVPLFFLAAAVSIRWSYFQKLNQRREERKFAERMRKAGRLMDWQKFKQAQENGMGTAIGEYLSTKGPFRLWWTAEDIPAVSPHRWQREQHFAWMEDEFRPFCDWCYARYTNPRSGTARLIVVPEEERKQLRRLVDGPHFVSTCSFLSVREKGTTNTSPD